MMQLSLLFPGEEAYPLPVTSRYRKRLQKVATMAFRLGVLRTEQRMMAEPVAMALGAGAVSNVCTQTKCASVADVATHAAPVGETMAPSGVMTRPLAHDERGEIAAIARRLQRLAPSHRSPEHFHIEKSEIIAGLRKITRDQKGCR